MGCGTSGDPQADQTTEEEADVLESYLKLEKEIWQVERAPPAPALSQAMLRLSRLAAELEDAITDLSIEKEDLPIPGSVPDVRTRKGEPDDDALRRVIQQLGLNRNPELSLEHEEFIANLNRRAMVETRINWLLRRREEAQKEVDRLSVNMQNLQTLYERQNAILRILEEGGQNEDTKEAERVRAYRDALYSGELSWREAARMVAAAAVLAKAATADWVQVTDQQEEETRWKLAVDARQGLQESVLCIQAAQVILMGVQFPYCTPREQSTVLQALEYLFTDLQIPERYNHASKLFQNFYQRAAALHLWLKKMTKETIHKDVVEADQRFGQLATKVTNYRVNLIRQLAGMGVVKVYNREETAHLKGSSSHKQLSPKIESEGLFSFPNE